MTQTKFRYCPSTKKMRFLLIFVIEEIGGD